MGDLMFSGFHGAPLGQAAAAKFASLESYTRNTSLTGLEDPGAPQFEPAPP